jgi:hypothetical protein
MAFTSCRLGKEELKLFYRVKIVPDESSIVYISMEIEDIDTREVVLGAYEEEKYLGISNLQVWTEGGVSLPHRSAKEVASGLIYHYIDTQGKHKLYVTYQVRPGIPIGGGHGRKPLSVGGYIGKDFGLLSGRTLFLVPRSPLSSIQVEIQAPTSWTVAATWPQISENNTVFQPQIYKTKGAEDLINGAVGLGSLDSYEKTIEGTLVRIFTYRNWPETYQNQIVNNSFALYEQISRIFETPIHDSYTLFYTPPTAESLDIDILATSNGQGSAMWPATPSRWISIAEKIAYRWLRYLPHRMEFKKVEDMWFVDGAALYIALCVNTVIGTIKEIEPYLVELNRNYNNHKLVFSKSKNFPANFYKLRSNRLDQWPREASTALASYLDYLIQDQTKGKVNLHVVLRQAYKHRYEVDLHEIVQETTQIDLDEFLTNYINSSITPLLYKSRRLPGTFEVKLPWERVHTGIGDTITLVLTGQTQSFLEACGCKANQSGGITRRATLIKQIKQQRKHMAVLDAGNTFPRAKDVPFIDDLTSSEIDVYLASLHKMGYSFSAIATNEVYYGAQFLLSKLATSPLPLISANLYYQMKLLAQPVFSVDVGPYRIGFLGILQRPVSISPSRLEDNTASVDISDPIEAIRTYLPSLRRHNDYVGVIGQLHTELVYKVVETFPDLDLVITLGHQYPTIDTLYADNQVAQVKDALYGFLGNTLVFYANADVYGLHQVDIGIDANKRLVKMEGSYMEIFSTTREDREMSELLESYYRATATQASLLAGQVKPLFSWDEISKEREYVGIEHCATCHTSQADHWKETRHASAYATLLEAHRHYYPKCVVCHVAGLGRPDGFDIIKPEEGLANVQCEICHGPASLHIQNPVKQTIRRKPPEQICLECHNADHDDDFVYARDYQLVNH